MYFVCSIPTYACRQGFRTKIDCDSSASACGGKSFNVFRPALSVGSHAVQFGKSLFSAGQQGVQTVSEDVLLMIGDSLVV